MSQPLDRLLLDSLSQFICERTALNFGPDRWGDLQRGIGLAAEDFGFADVSECIHWLLREPLNTVQIGKLAARLTVGETYFFRDHALFRLMRERILPELIQSRNSGGVLRIWSAACCSGEEAYTLAITLTQLLPSPGSRNVKILATDINPRFLERARAGIYGEWSFRGVEPHIRQKYFREIARGKFEILPAIREMVTFRQLNLAEESYPSAGNETESQDLIFCRNAIMYFSAAQTARVSDRLGRSLRNGGYLVVGATETSSLLASQLNAVSMDGITIYRRPAPGARVAEPVYSQPVFSAPVFIPPDLPVIPERLMEFPKPVLPPPPEPDLGEMIGQIRAAANLGDLDSAMKLCDRAIEVEKLNPHLHYLRGTILQEAGDWDHAADALRRVIYLQPEFVMAHIALANLAQIRGRSGEAERSRLNALELIGRCRPDDIVEECEGLTAARLSQMLSAGARPMKGRP